MTLTGAIHLNYGGARAWRCIQYKDFVAKCMDGCFVGRTKVGSTTSSSTSSIRPHAWVGQGMFWGK